MANKGSQLTRQTFVEIAQLKTLPIPILDLFPWNARNDSSLQKVTHPTTNQARWWHGDKESTQMGNLLLQTQTIYDLRQDRTEKSWCLEERGLNIGPNSCERTRLWSSMVCGDLTPPPKYFNHWNRHEEFSARARRKSNPGDLFTLQTVTREIF